VSPAWFAPQSQDVGLPLPLAARPSDYNASNGGNPEAKEKTCGYLEERVERDAWCSALDAHTRLWDARGTVAEAEAEAERKRAEGEVKDIYMSVMG